jgi:hypothetical protein
MTRSFLCPAGRSAGSLLAVSIAFAAPGARLEGREAAFWSPTRVDLRPELDGRLEDEAWRGLEPITSFSQVEPRTGAPGSVRTEVYLAYDDEALYFAVVAHDPEAGGMVATQRKRDADLSGDDHVVLVLDPFLDRRNGYAFTFNPLGARHDALIRGGSTLNPDWDGQWEVVARVTEDGWVAEGAIPFSTLSFRAGVEAWGLNLERYVARTGERLRWHGPERQYAVHNLANAGNLLGLGELRRRTRFELRPFVTAGVARDHVSETTETRFEPGFDLFYQLTEATTAVLTVNTDFADAEVDDRVVNLTRFPVRFPEKRAFFLQDAGVFSYSLINNNPLPYYSRRIGLGPQGQVIDLLGGLRISGREGPVNFGFLGVRTEAEGALEAKTLGVGRVLLNLSDEASAGVIGTWGDPRRNREAWLAGTDLNYTTGRFLGKPAHLLNASLYFQRTRGPDRTEDSDAFGWGLIYDSPSWGFTSYLDRVGAGYDPALGRVSQTGVYTVTARLDREFNPRPLKSLVPTVTFMRRHSLRYRDRELETFGAELTAETTRGDNLLVRVRQEHEYLDPSDRFSVGPGILVQSGNFTGQRFEGKVTFSRARPFAATLGVSRLPYYGGHQMVYSQALSWRPSAFFNLEAGFDYTTVALPYARFPVRLGRLGATFQFAPTLVWSVLGQYDNLSRQVGLNTRVRWTYAPGGDLFLVLNHGAEVEDGRWEATRTELSAKIGATLRF